MRIALMAVGLPGSGKTTILRPLAEKYGFSYINRDDIREELFGDARNQSNNKEVWEEANRRTAADLATGKGVILDATFLERWKRESMINFLREHDADRVIGVLFDVPAEVARERNALRDRVVPNETMDWMQRKLETEPPKLSEGFDALYTYREIEERDLREL